MNPEHHRPPTSSRFGLGGRRGSGQKDGSAGTQPSFRTNNMSFSRGMNRAKAGFDGKGAASQAGGVAPEATLPATSGAESAKDGQSLALGLGLLTQSSPSIWPSSFEIPAASPFQTTDFGIVPVAAGRRPGSNYQTRVNSQQNSQVKEEVQVDGELGEEHVAIAAQIATDDGIQAWIAERRRRFPRSKPVEKTEVEVTSATGRSGPGLPQGCFRVLVNAYSDDEDEEMEAQEKSKEVRSTPERKRTGTRPDKVKKNRKMKGKNGGEDRSGSEADSELGPITRSRRAEQVEESAARRPTARQSHRQLLADRQLDDEIRNALSALRELVDDRIF